MDANSCYTKTGNYFNGYPEFTNGLFNLFKTNDSRWAIATTSTNTSANWYFYTDVTTNNPINSTWYLGTSGTGSIGTFINCANVLLMEDASEINLENGNLLVGG